MQMQRPLTLTQLAAPPANTEWRIELAHSAMLNCEDSQAYWTARNVLYGGEWAAPDPLHVWIARVLAEPAPGSHWLLGWAPMRMATRIVARAEENMEEGCIAIDASDWTSHDVRVIAGDVGMLEEVTDELDGSREHNEEEQTREGALVLAALAALPDGGAWDILLGWEEEATE